MTHKKSSFPFFCHSGEPWIGLQDRRRNPLDPAGSGCRIKARPGLDPGSGMMVKGIFMKPLILET
jgi:hypothetical protein